MVQCKRVPLHSHDGCHLNFVRNAAFSTILPSNGPFPRRMALGQSPLPTSSSRSLSPIKAALFREAARGHNDSLAGRVALLFFAHVRARTSSFQPLVLCTLFSLAIRTKCHPRETWARLKRPKESPRSRDKGSIPIRKRGRKSGTRVPGPIQTVHLKKKQMSCPSTLTLCTLL